LPEIDLTISIETNDRRTWFGTPDSPAERRVQGPVARRDLLPRNRRRGPRSAAPPGSALP